MRVGVPKETAEGERRVALVPEVVGKLTRDPAEDGAERIEVVVERGAGAGALLPDSQYEEAGARMTEDPGEVWSSDVVAKVAAPSEDEIQRLSSETTLIGFLQPLTNADAVRGIAQTGATSFAMESIP